MRVVFLEDVSGVAQGGDVKEVKNGFARNYLIPKNLAEPATHNALQRIERLKKQSDDTRLKILADVRALAEELDGVQVNVEMRVGGRGRLYGSVTNAIVAEELSRITGREIDRRTLEIAEPIRQLGMFGVGLRLHPEVKAEVKVLVYAAGTDPAAQEDGGEGVEGEAEAVDTGDEVAETETVHTKDEVAEIETVDTKDEVAETETVDTKDEVAETETVDTEDEVAETETVDTKDEVAETEAVDTEDEVAETETVDTEDEVTETEAVDTKDEVADTEAVDTGAASDERS